MDRTRRICAALMVVFAIGGSLPTQAEDLVGKKAPDFKLMDCEGKETTLSQFSGKIVVLNFWRTTCFPCLEEIPDLVKIYEEYRDKGVVVLGIAVNDNPTDVDNKVQVLQVEYPMARDDMATRLKYQIKSVPHTFIIDRNGIVRHHFDRKTDKKAIEEALKPLLAQKAVETE